MIFKDDSYYIDVVAKEPLQYSGSFKSTLLHDDVAIVVPREPNYDEYLEYIILNGYIQGVIIDLETDIIVDCRSHGPIATKVIYVVERLITKTDNCRQWAEFTNNNPAVKRLIEIEEDIQHGNVSVESIKDLLPDFYEIVLVILMTKHICDYDVRSWNLGFRKNGEVVVFDAFMN